MSVDVNGAGESQKDVRPTVDEVLERLRGDREAFRNIITDKDQLLAKLCRYAELKGESYSVSPGSVVGEILGHGSGVASAIYELYRDYQEGAVQPAVRRLRIVAPHTENKGATARDVDTGEQHRLCFFCSLPEDEHNPKCPTESTRSVFVD